MGPFWVKPVVTVVTYAGLCFTGKFPFQAAETPKFSPFQRDVRNRLKHNYKWSSSVQFISSFRVGDKRNNQTKFCDEQKHSLLYKHKISLENCVCTISCISINLRIILTPKSETTIFGMLNLGYFRVWNGESWAIK